MAAMKSKCSHFLCSGSSTLMQYLICSTFLNMVHTLCDTKCKWSCKEKNLQNTNCKLQITNHKLQNTNDKWQITNHKSQITNYKLKITNYKLQNVQEWWQQGGTLRMLTSVGCLAPAPLILQDHQPQDHKSSS